MKVLVCGDRNWINSTAMIREFEKLPKDTVIIEGDARGADKWAGKLGKSLFGFEIVVVPADWEKYGRSAGPIRNKVMLDMKPDLVLAFHSNIEESKGTKNMVAIARRAGVDVKIFKN